MPAGDYGNRKRPLLLWFSVFGAVCQVAVASLATPGAWIALVVLLILANVGYGGAYVMYNAYLPLLAEQHPDVLAEAATSTGDEGRDSLKVEHT